MTDGWGVFWRFMACVIMMVVFGFALRMAEGLLGDSLTLEAYRFLAIMAFVRFVCPAVFR